jgi:hypothetical protein
MLFLLLMIGCSPSKPVRVEKPKQEPPPKEKKLPLSEYEVTLNPVDFDQEVEIVQKAHTEEKKQIQLDIPKDSTIVQQQIVQGFRIQVLSSSSFDEANLVKSILMEKFSSDSVYVVYDAPVYKVRTGDFINRYEANQRLPEFIEKGYRDAWIVPDQVVQRKLVRIPLPK